MLHADPQVTVLSLNYNEGSEEAEEFIKQYEINWANGFSNDEINQVFLVVGLPHGVLIDMEGIIMDPFIRAHEVSSKIGTS